MKAHNYIHGKSIGRGNYLASTHKVRINAVFFRVFKDGAHGGTQSIGVPDLGLGEIKAIKPGDAWLKSGELKAILAEKARVDLTTSASRQAKVTPLLA